MHVAAHHPHPRERPHPRTSRVARVGTLLAGVALLTACAGDATTGPDAASGQPETAADHAAATGVGVTFPVTVDNCGTEVTFAEPPERVVTIKSTSTELLLALGVGDRIVAQAFQDGPVPVQWAEDAADIPLISDSAPGQEAVLEHEPDLILAGWESNLAADTAGERETLAALGVNSYVSPAACQGGGYQPDPMTFELLFSHFEEAGRILGVPDAAADLVAGQRAELAGVVRLEPGTTALWWSSGGDTPFVGGGIGAPQMVLEAVGLENVAGDLDQTWSPWGWEAIIDADPDVFVLVDSGWNTAESKIEFLESSPATAGLTAVQQGRYLILPFPAAEAGVRSVPAVSDLIRQLGELGLTGSAG